MELREQFLALVESQGAKIQKIKKAGKVLYEVNGSLLYITFSKNLGSGDEEKYFLQVNQEKLERALSQNKSLFILLICGDVDNTFVIPVDEFLNMVKDYEVAADGNWKINISGRREILKINEYYEVKLGRNKYYITDYKNKFEILRAKEEVVKGITSVIQSLQDSKLKGGVEEPKILLPTTYRIELGKREGVALNYEKLIALSESGDGSQFEKAIMLFLKYLGFGIDEATSGKAGELDIICLSPIKIGIECRSTERRVGADIIDELKRHLRRYEVRNGYPKDSFKGLIICADTTEQFIEDAVTEKVFSLKVPSFVKLIQLSRICPISPYEFENFFSEYGNIDEVMLSFIGDKQRSVKLREDVLSILAQKTRPLNYYEIRTLLENQGWNVEDTERELNKALIELSSPLINAVGIVNDKYEYIRCLKVEDQTTIQELQQILK